MRLVVLALLLIPPAVDFDVQVATEFNKILAGDSVVLKPSTGFQFVEGPVWNPVTQELIFSDISGNKMYRWTSAGGATVFRDPSGRTNGNTLDREGRLLSCEQTAQRVSRTELNGSVGTVVDTYTGLKFHAPNDVVVKSDGTIWFTDPDYSSPGTTLVPKSVYRYTPSTGDLTAMVTDFNQPNGICFSPDETKLYVADSGTPHHIRVFDVAANNALSNDTIFKVITPGAPDGIRCDRDGRVFSSAGNGIQVFLPDGTLIGSILIPETPTNLCFGGSDGQTLFVTAQTSLYTVHLATRGSGVASGNPLPAQGGGGGGGGGCGLLGLEAVVLLSVLRRRRAGARSTSR